MKYLLLSLILSVSAISQSLAISTNQVKRCDSLRLTDGRTVAVHIIRQSEDMIFIAHCGDATMKERPLLKRFVEAVIVNGRVTQEPASYLKSNKRKQKKNLETTKTMKILVWGGLAAIVGYIARGFIARFFFYGFFWLILR